MQAEMLKNIKELNDLILTEELSIEDLKSFKNEILLNEKIIKEIKKQDKIEEEQQETTTKNNNLIFMTTQSGNIRALDEIKSIDSSYYDGFIGLFDSIIDGSFKNVKRFKKTNTKLYGVSEVKDFKIRVVFDRIGPNDYAIISAFVKKTDNDKSYQNKLREKTQNYHDKESSIKECLKNESFRKEQMLVQEELFSVLGKNINSPKDLKKEAK